MINWTLSKFEETWPHYTLSDKESFILTRPSEPVLGLTLTKKAMIIVYLDPRHHVDCLLSVTNNKSLEIHSIHV